MLALRRFIAGAAVSMTWGMLSGARLALLALVIVGALLPAGTASADCSTTPSSLFASPFEVCASATFEATPNPVDPAVGTVSFDASDSSAEDEDGPVPIAAYVWDFGDSSGTSTGGPTTSHRYARGRWSAKLILQDRDGEELATSNVVEIVVSLAPSVGLAAVSGTLRPGVDYAFTATGTPDTGGTIDHYVWDWGDGTRTVNGSAVEHHVFADDGVSTSVTVTAVNDLDVASAPSSQPVLVDNLDPLVQLTGPASVAVGEPIQLSAAGSSDPDGAIAEYRWDLDGDGVYETSSRLVPQAQTAGFANPGVVVVGVKVIDDSRDFTTEQLVVNVTGEGTGATGDAGSDDDERRGGAGASSGAGGSSGGGFGGAPTGTAFGVNLTGSAVQRLAVALKRGIGLRAAANRAATGTLTVTVSASDARKLRIPGRKGHKPVAIGTLRVSLKAGKLAKASIKLKRGAAKALRRSRPATLRVSVAGTLRAGAATASAGRVVLLRG